MFGMMDQAWVHAVAKGKCRIDPKRCGYCLKRREKGKVKLRRCVHCVENTKTNDYVKRYCSKLCQKKDWPSHRNECGELYPAE